MKKKRAVKAGLTERKTTKGTKKIDRNKEKRDHSQYKTVKIRVDFSLTSILLPDGRLVLKEVPARHGVEVVVFADVLVASVR